jgi:hypothetical protein
MMFGKYAEVKYRVAEEEGDAETHDAWESPSAFFWVGTANWWTRDRPKIRLNSPS